MNKKTFIALLIILVAAIAWWMMAGPGSMPADQGAQVEETPEITEENVTEIDAELEGLDFGDIDAELESIDAELDTL